MKTKQMVAVGISAVIAIGTFALAMSLGNKPAEQKIVEKTVDSTKVLVARADIGLGQVVNRDSFRWQEWPKGAATGFIQENIRPKAIEELAGAVARAPLALNEPVMAIKLVKAGDGGVLSAILPPGMRAVSTRIKEETAAGKMILPNDHVDVILIQRKRGRTGNDEFIADTLFRNVRVLAIGQTLEMKDPNKKTAAEGATATVELTPRQTEILALANSMGEISLALRSVADIATTRDPGTGKGLSERGNAIRVLRYGVKSRAYGAN